MARPEDHAAPVERARRSLDGLSVGDAFGERFFGSPSTVQQRIAGRATPSGSWRYTDDTVMALSITEVLERHGGIDEDELARSFARKYVRAPDRGYGSGAHQLLTAIATGADWREVSPAAFGGTGSMGNGGAMRAAPIGAYFADDLRAAIEHARRSALVTHAHPEGQAGAMAVALAAAVASSGEDLSGGFFEAVLAHLPPSATRAGIAQAASLSPGCGVDAAVGALGNGSQVLAQDTVPFALWCAAYHLRDFEQALWTTVAGLGDRDTTCAIVGGILCSHAEVAIPPTWLTAREPLSAMAG